TCTSVQFSRSVRSLRPLLLFVTPRPPSSTLFPYTTLFRSLDPARAAAQGHVASGVFLGPFGAATDGADGVQSVVPLVRRTGDGCTGLGRLDVLQEPGSPA